MAHQVSFKTNLFVTFFFCYPKHKIVFQVEWEYPAISNGKEVVNGISWTAKFQVYAEVNTRTTVQNAIVFTAVVAIVVQSITVISLLQNDISKTHIDLNLAKDVLRIKKAQHIMLTVLTTTFVYLPVSKI